MSMKELKEHYKTNYFFEKNNQDLKEVSSFEVVVGVSRK